MARVTDSEVKEIIVTTTDTSPFITTATLIVDEELLGQGYSAARLKQIELYLAAHYTALTVERGGISKQEVGDGSESYQKISSRFNGLSTTRFGQQAIMLDSSGILGGLSNKPVKAQFRVVSLE